MQGVINCILRVTNGPCLYIKIIIFIYIYYYVCNKYAIPIGLCFIFTACYIINSHRLIHWCGLNLI